MLDQVIPRLRDLLSLTAPLAFVDVETTGVLPSDRIVQIAIVRVELDGSVETLHTLIDPERDIPAEATAVHGITNEMVRGAQTFWGLAKPIAHLLGRGAILAAYNGRFDVKMLAAEFERAHVPNPIAGAALIDPFVMFVRKNPRDLAAYVAKYGRLQLTDAHDAMADVVGTVDAMLGQLEAERDLPRDTQALAAWCLPERDPSWLDSEGKVAWRDGEARITFGKNAGRSLRELARRDQNYLRWLLRADFNDDVKRLVRDAMHGRYPSAPPVGASVQPVEA